ncbi:MAG: outer membrane beta-barrel protein [Vicinamibacterales bacterium]
MAASIVLKRFPDFLVGVAVASALALAVPASAQQADADPVADAPVRIGALGLAPRVTLTNLGVDTNVFNEAGDARQDFTFTASPGTEAWLRLGRGLVTATGRVDLVYFQKYEAERSANLYSDVRFDYRANRLRPFVGVSGIRTRERPGYEIDARAQRIESGLQVGLAARVGAKSTVEVSAHRRRYQYDGDAVFGGQALNQVLDRTLDTVQVEWQQHLTVLTTWVFRVAGERERFEHAPERNADTTRIQTGLELGQFALIRGNAFVGYRRLMSADGGTLPEYSGITAEVGVSYTAPTRTRLSADVTRDVQYSFDRANPYYVQTGWTATLTQAIVGRFDLQLLGGRDRLAYRPVGGRTAAGESLRGTDRVNRIGGGLGYALDADKRIGFDVQLLERLSSLQPRSYRGIRAGLSVTYGF